MNNPCPRVRNQGFTLVEMSVVLIIVALITGMAMSSGVAVLSSARFSATNQKIAAIDQALMSFRTAYNRLPCPGSLTIQNGGTNYGIEAGGAAACTTGTGVCTGSTVSGTCIGTALAPVANNAAAGTNNAASTGAEGAIPTATLGLPSDFMFDGWGNRFRYAVDANMTASNAFATYPMGCVNGAVTVYDASGTARSIGALYAIISHGANGHGAYSTSSSMKNAGSLNTNEQTNCHCTAAGAAGTYAPNYVQGDVTGNGYTTFDDIVNYKERWQLQTGNDPVGSSCTPIGRIAITDYGNNRVEVFDASGHYLFAMGTGYNGVSGTPGNPGTGNGQLTNPVEAVVDPSGNYWVSDTATHRIQKYNSAGSWLGSLGGGAGGGAVGNCATPPCAELCTSGTCPTAGGSSPGMLNSTYDTMAFDPSGNLWVADDGNNGLVQFNLAGSYLQEVFLGWGSGNGQTGAGIKGIAIDKYGNFWVVDPANYRVEQISPGGAWIQTLGGGPSCIACASTSSCTCSQGSGPGYFGYPDNVAIDGIGNIWIPDSYQGSGPVTDFLSEYNSTGAYMKQIGGHGSGSNQFNDLNGVAFTASGNIWASDAFNNRIVNLTASGSFLSQFPCASGACTGSSANGQITNPDGINISR